MKEKSAKKYNPRPVLSDTNRWHLFAISLDCLIQFFNQTGIRTLQRAIKCTVTPEHLRNLFNSENIY